LIDPASAPKQGDEGAPDAWLAFEPADPIGLHRVEIASIAGGRVRVRKLEAVDGTPIIDVKPVLSSDLSER
jgi:hypothetical protein